MSKTVDQYLEKQEQWRNELVYLRNLAGSHDFKETVKWGFPVYTSGGKNLIGLGAFKGYVGLWFFQGALLQDKAGLLVNAQEGKTQAMRQWRFGSMDEIKAKEELIHSYLEEAIALQKAGKEIKAKTGKPLVIPSALQEAFRADSDLKSAFDALNLTRQRDFAEHIETAKREETKQNRLEKIIPMIKAGIGLNDKYK